MKRLLRPLERRFLLRAKYNRWSAIVRSVGPRDAARFWYGEKVAARWPIGAKYRLYSGAAEHPLVARKGSSDLDVFEQIFVEREYAGLDDLVDARLVIDCGANVGYSSAWFLSRWPQARVFAVEPDPSNFEILVRNLAPYGPRATAIQAGVWSHPCSLKLVETPYGDGRQWSRQVQECESGEPGALEAIDIPTLLRRAGGGRISLLKIDIEGAEAVVFSGSCDWLDEVDNITIELHDDSQFGSGSEVFFRAIEGRGFSISHAGELTVARRTERMVTAAS